MNGAFWTVTARIVTQVLQFVVMVTAARLLGPAEFGVFALVSGFSFLLLTFSKLGWFEQIQQPEIEKTDFEPIFWTAMTISAVVCALGLAGAGGLQLFGFNLGAATLAVFMVWVVAATMTGVQYGVIMRLTGPARVGQSQIVAEVVSAITSILFLALGLSIVSIALGRLCGELAAMAFAAIRSGWLPSWRRRATALPRYFPFVSQIFYARIIAFAQQNLSVFISGAFMGAVGTGLFRIGSRFSGALAEVVQEPARLYAWSAMRRGGDQAALPPRETIAQTAERIIIAVLFIATPLFAGMAVTSHSLMEVLLGPEWTGASPVIAILCLAALVQVCAVISEPLLTLSGHVTKLPPIALVSTICSIGGLVLLSPFGLAWAATGQLLGSIVLAGLTIWISARYAGIVWSRIWRGAWPTLIASAVMTASLYALEWYVLPGLHPFARLTIEVTSGIVVFGLGIAILAPARLRLIANAIGPVLARYRASTAR